MRTLALLAGAAVVFTLTGCGTSDQPRTAQPHTTTPAASAAASPTGTVTPPTAGATTRPTTAPPGAPTTGCPATAETLLAALRAPGSDVDTRAAHPAALHQVSCHERFAVASTVPDGQHQPSRIVFGYDAASTTWRPLNLGSSGFCAGYVPDHLAANLAGCTS
ncbi:hypothetical protein AB0M43_24375 [Longispora sp. NPDC051575]|uniref:hypothetical protein n=1 Tax=Longispora sp. NPDC051575 TaxID=3154943 RepID=UPI00341C6922